MPKPIIRVALAVICAALFFSAGHPYYLSVAELRHNPTEKSVEGSVKFFVHDLESALRKLGHAKIDLIHPKDRSATQQVLGDYFGKRFVLRAGGVTVSHRVLGFEQESEHLWLHVVFSPCRLPGELHITNTLLYDHFKQQMNIVHFEANGKSQSHKLTNPEKEMRFAVR